MKNIFKKTEEYKDFKAKYFSKFCVVITLISAFSSFMWSFKDIFQIGANPIHSFLLRVLPSFILLGFFYTIKNEPRATWKVAFLYTWASIIAAIIDNYLISQLGSGLTGDGWISYFIVFFMISIIATNQTFIYISNIVYPALIIALSDEFFGKMHYVIPILRPMSTGIILSFGLSLCSIFIRKIIHNLYENEKLLRDLSKIDTLSKAFNRQKLDDLLDKNDKFKNNVTLFMIDIDEFKKINDGFGHIAGDEAIKFTANLLKRITRANDYIIRFGGDEFLIIFENFIDEEYLYERIKEQLNKEDNRYGVTFSIGSFRCDANEYTFQAAIKMADAALYESKENGRNRITSF